MDTKSIATIAGAAAAGGVLAFAGLSLANATTGAGVQTPAAGDYRGMGQMGPGGMHGTPVTGEDADKVKEAVLAQYPDATVDFVVAEGDGFEAHITKADGSRWDVTLSADFVVTGEHQGPGMGEMPGGPGGPHGTPVTGEAADKVKAAVLAQYPDASVLFVEEEGTGYEAHVRKGDGTVVHVTLDADFAITGEHQGPPMGMGGRGPNGEKPLTGAKAKKVRAAARAEVPGGTVVRVEKDAEGVYEAHVITKNRRFVVVEVNKNFVVTDVTKMPKMGGPHGGPPPMDPGTQQGAGA